MSCLFLAGFTRVERGDGIEGRGRSDAGVHGVPELAPPLGREPVDKLAGIDGNQPGLLVALADGAGVVEDQSMQGDLATDLVEVALEHGNLLLQAVGLVPGSLAVRAALAFALAVLLLDRRRAIVVAVVLEHPPLERDRMVETA